METKKPTTIRSLVREVLAEMKLTGYNTAPADATLKKVTVKKDNTNQTAAQKTLTPAMSTKKPAEKCGRKKMPEESDKMKKIVASKVNATRKTETTTIPKKVKTEKVIARKKVSVKESTDPVLAATQRALDEYRQKQKAATSNLEVTIEIGSTPERIDFDFLTSNAGAIEKYLETAFFDVATNVDQAVYDRIEQAKSDDLDNSLTEDNNKIELVVDTGTKTIKLKNPAPASTHPAAPVVVPPTAPTFEQ